MCSLLYTRVDGVTLGREGMGVSAYIIIFVTVMVATGIMSPESQKASNSPHE